LQAAVLEVAKVRLALVVVAAVLEVIKLLQVFHFL
jgi:hypothetical protein